MVDCQLSCKNKIVLVANGVLVGGGKRGGGGGTKTQTQTRLMRDSD